MQAAEDLTDPAADAVYDGMGLVPTRRSVDYHWILHSLYIDRFRRAGDLRLEKMLSETPAEVIIPNYRTDWLPSDDHAFIRSRYVPLSDDFWLLGGILGPGGGTARIVQEGRYRLVSMKAQTPASASVQQALRDYRSLSGSQTPTGVTVDGRTVTDHVVHLTAGPHEITSPANCRLVFLWTGPRLADVPRIGHGDHRALFASWY